MNERAGDQAACGLLLSTEELDSRFSAIGDLGQNSHEVYRELPAKFPAHPVV